MPKYPCPFRPSSIGKPANNKKVALNVLMRAREEINCDLADIAESIPDDNSLKKDEL